jgi:hypothetical protein
MNGNTPATNARSSVNNDHDGLMNGRPNKRKEAPVANSSQYNVGNILYWEEVNNEFEKLERSNSYSEILQFVQKKMPHLGGRTDLEAAAIPPVPAAVQEEPTPTLLLVRSDSSTFTGALLVAEPAALEASLKEINEILGNEESLRDMAKDRCSKNTELKRLESQLSAEVFRLIWDSEYTAVKKSLTNRMTNIKNRMQLVEAMTNMENQMVEAMTNMENQMVEAKIVAKYKAYISGANKKATEVSLHLLSLTGLSQLTEVTYAQTTTDANEVKAQVENRKQLVRDNQRLEDSGMQLANPNMIRDRVVQNAKPFDEYSEASLIKCFDEHIEKPLVAISKVYEALFSNACFLPRRFDTPTEKPFYCEMLQKAISYLELVEKQIRDGTMCEESCSIICEEIRKENVHADLVTELLALDEWQRSSKSPRKNKKPKIGSYEWLDKATVAALEQLTEDGLSPESSKTLKGLLDKFMPQLLWLPGPTCQEVHGVQVVFQRLLDAITACLPASTTVGEEGHKRTTPEKHVKAERSLASTEYRPGRRSDFSIWIRENYLAIMWDDAMEVTIEVKPGQRMVSTLAALYQECLNQGLSHAAKSLFPALNLASGLPAHCTFVVASPVYVQVLMLSTVDTGTPNARLLLKKSVRFPLVSIGSCNRFYASDQRHDKEVNAEFLGKTKDVDCILAIKALAKIMTSPRDDLVGLSRRDSLLRVLGSGTYGQVLWTGTTNLVLKVSRYGRISHLVAEVAVLQMLSKDRSVDEVGQSNVISLVQFGMFPAKYCGVEMPGATLSPRGVSAVGFNFHDRLGKVASDLRNGLTFLHSRGVAHNDFSYRNFVLVDLVDSWRAVIIDLACAQPINTEMKEFVGTPDFAHVDVHMKPDLWLARAAHDMAGLAYTLCVVQNAGKIPWKPIGQPCKDKIILKERDEKTRSMFEAKLKEQLKEELVEELLAALQSKPIRGCQCKSGNCGGGCKCEVCTDSCTCNKSMCKKAKPAPLAIDSVSEHDFFQNVLSLDDTNGDFAGPKSL